MSASAACSAPSDDRASCRPFEFGSSAIGSRARPAAPVPACADPGCTSAPGTSSAGGRSYPPLPPPPPHAASRKVIASTQDATSVGASALRVMDFVLDIDGGERPAYRFRRRASPCPPYASKQAHHDSRPRVTRAFRARDTAMSRAHGRMRTTRRHGDVVVDAHDDCRRAGERIDGAALSRAHRTQTRLGRVRGADVGGCAAKAAAEESVQAVAIPEGTVGQAVETAEGALGEPQRACLAVDETAWSAAAATIWGPLALRIRY